MTAPEDQNGLREALAREDLMVRLYTEGRTLREIAPIVSLTHGINLTHGGVQAALRRRGVALRKKARRPDLPRSPKRKDWKYRALAAEAEITRLKEGMEALGKRCAALQLVAMIQARELKALAPDGQTPADLNAAMAALATLSPKEQP